MCCMLAQVVQVSTCARESFGCIGMPIERFHFVCIKVAQLIVQLLEWLITTQDVV